MGFTRWLFYFLSLMAGGSQLAVEIQLWTFTYVLGRLFYQLNWSLKSVIEKPNISAKKLTNIRLLIGRVFDLSAAVNSCYGFCILVFLVSRSVFVHHNCYKLINYFYHFVIGSLSKAADSNVLTNGRNLCIQSIRIYIQVVTCNTVLKEVFILCICNEFSQHAKPKQKIYFVLMLPTQIKNYFPKSCFFYKYIQCGDWRPNIY